MNNVVWMLNRDNGAVVGKIGHAGHAGRAVPLPARGDDGFARQPLHRRSRVGQESSEVRSCKLSRAHAYAPRNPKLRNCGRDSAAPPAGFCKGIPTRHPGEFFRPAQRLRQPHSHLGRPGEISAVAGPHLYARDRVARRNDCAAPGASYRPRGDRHAGRLRDRQCRYALRNEGTRQKRPRYCGDRR